MSENLISVITIASKAAIEILFQQKLQTYLDNYFINKFPDKHLTVAIKVQGNAWMKLFTTFSSIIGTVAAAKIFRSVIYPIIYKTYYVTMYFAKSVRTNYLLKYSSHNETKNNETNSIVPHAQPVQPVNNFKIPSGSPGPSSSASKI